MDRHQRMNPTGLCLRPLVPILCALLLPLATASSLCAREPVDGAAGPAMFSCTAAGDYRWIEVSAGESVLFLRSDRVGNLIAASDQPLETQARGHLDKVLDDLTQEAFSSFYPYRSKGSLVVEDRYYSILSAGTAAEWVVAHELSVPKRLSPLVLALESFQTEAIEEPSPSQSYLVALPPTMAWCIDAAAPTYSFSTQAPPSIASAVATPGRAIPLEKAELDHLRSALFEAHLAIKVSLPESELLLFAFGGS